MKRRTIARVLLLMFIACFGVSFSGCENGKFGQIPLRNTEYYIYTAIENQDNTRILGLTDKGKEQEYLIIPESIDGKRVERIGCVNALESDRVEEVYGNSSYSDFKSAKLKKIFVNSDIEIYSYWASFNIHSDSPEFEGLFYVKNNKCHVSVDPYYYSTRDNQNCRKANVSYFYNFEKAENDGYYWIDNYDYGTKIDFVPENPKRGWYVFDGWYKEKECINKWDFEKDVLPEELLDEDGNTVFQETKLFAKWTV